MEEFSPFRAVFNLYETTPPAPGFKTFLEGAKHTFDFVEKDPSFVVGQLHKNLDPEGLFKFAHYASFRDASFQAFKREPSPEWLAVIEEGHGKWGHQIRHPGGFEEIGSWSGEKWCPETQVADNSIFLLSMFKDVPEDFEENWKTLSGATILSESLPKDVVFHQAGLYRKLGGPTQFRYILRCELLPVPSDESAGYTEILGSLGDLRKKLSEDEVPFVNLSAYKIIDVSNEIRESAVVEPEGKESSV